MKNLLIMSALAFIMVGCAVPKPEPIKYGYHEHDSRREYCSKGEFIRLRDALIKCVAKHHQDMASLMLRELMFDSDEIKFISEGKLMRLERACLEPIMTKTNCVHRKVYHVGRYGGFADRSGFKPCLEATGEAKRACDDYRSRND